MDEVSRLYFSSLFLERRVCSRINNLEYRRPKIGFMVILKCEIWSYEYALQAERLVIGKLRA